MFEKKRYVVQALANLGRVVVAAVSVFGTQMYQAVTRPDLPSFADQDPSGTFGSDGSPTLRVVVLGDSSVTAPGIPIEESWIRRMTIHLAQSYRVELRSVAIGGSKAADLLELQISPAIDIGGDMALISIGANDALRGTPVRRFESTLDDAVRRLNAHFDMVGVSGVGDLGTLPRLPLLAQTIVRNRARTINEAIRRVANRHNDVVKGRSWGSMWDRFETDPGSMFAEDLFHASGTGHEVFGKAAIAVAEELLARRVLINESPESLESKT